MQRLDLNLLVALDAILAEGSVSAAARRVGLSVPAMSRTLARIRAMLGDPIFVRAGRRMVPTERAIGLRTDLQELLSRAQQILAPEELDLSVVRRVFTVRCAEAVAGTIGGELAGMLTSKAPGVTLRFVRDEDENIEALRDGRIDLQLGPLPSTGPELRIRRLYRDAYACVLAERHPLCSESMSMEVFLALPHVQSSRHGRLSGPLDDTLAARGHQRKVALVVPSHAAAAMVAANTQFIAILPSRLARRLRSTGLSIQIRPLPFKTEEFPIGLAWHPRFDTDPLHAWLRDRIAAVVKDAAGGV